jgi:hypothetical protein
MTSLTSLLVFAQLAIGSSVAMPVLSSQQSNPTITVEGRLELDGRNYFLDPRFVIVRGDHSRVAVTAWAPLEIPPLPPGVPLAISAIPHTMRQYLGRRLSVTGILRIAQAGVQSPIPRLGPGDEYLEVGAVVDLDSGETLFAAEPSADATAPQISVEADGATPVAMPAAIHPAEQSPSLQPASPSSAANEARPVLAPVAPSATPPDQVPSAHPVAAPASGNDPSPVPAPAAPPSAQATVGGVDR